jgi:hypothetical protein
MGATEGDLVTYPSDPQGQRPSPAPGGVATYPPSSPTNGFAITALVSSFVVAPLGIIFGYLALNQIRRSGEQGRGLAIGGLVVGCVMTVVSAISVVTFFGLFHSADVADDGLPDTQVQTSSRPASMTADNASSADFYNDSYFGDTERIDWANDQLQKNADDPDYPGLTAEQAAYQHVKTQLKRDSAVDLGPLVAPSQSNDANEADIQMLVVEAAALYEVDLDKAKKMVAASMRQDTAFYTSFVEDLEDIHRAVPTKQQLITMTIGFAFTNTNYNASNELVPVSTATTTAGALGNIRAFGGHPTRVAYMTETQVSNHVSSFEEVQAFMANRWIAVQKIESTEAGLWIPPSDLIGLPSR